MNVEDIELSNMALVCIICLVVQQLVDQYRDRINLNASSLQLIVLVCWIDEPDDLQYGAW